VDRLASLRVHLIYHTVFGDLATAHSVGLQMVESSRDKGSPSDITQALRYAAHAWRYAGDVEASMNALLECYELAEKYRVATAASTAAERLALLHLDSGDLASSNAWLERAQAWVAEDEMTRDNLATLLARLCIARGDFSMAYALGSASPNQILSDPILRRRIERAAVWLVLASFVDASHPSFPIVFDDLQFNHFALRGRGGQDFPAFALFVAMSRAGNPDQARTEMAAYINHFRRERGPMPKYIKDTLVT
jgi:hypothetical protein